MFYNKEDIEKQIKKLAEMYQMEAYQIKAAVPSEQLAADIELRKAIDFVVENSVEKAE